MCRAPLHHRAEAGKMDFYDTNPCYLNRICKEIARFNVPVQAHTPLHYHISIDSVKDGAWLDMDFTDVHFPFDAPIMQIVFKDGTTRDFTSKHYEWGCGMKMPVLIEQAMEFVERVCV